MAICYLSLDQAIEVHRKTIECSGGGTLGQLDVGQLESVLQNIQNDDYYPTFEAKLTHLFFCVCKFHCFADGNKRLAISLCAQMLLLNGFLGSTRWFFVEAENISYHVAAGAISKDLLGRWLICALEGDVDVESLQLEILQAISSCPQEPEPLA